MSNAVQDQLNNACEESDVGIMNYNSINKQTSDEFNLDNKISQEQVTFYKKSLFSSIVSLTSHTTYR